MPVIDVAMGPKHGELRGKARGIIAIGDDAMGLLAIGGMARGVVAIGGLALGAFSIGGAAVGLVAALGGAALGGIAVGGGAIGMLAVGGGAIGVVAQGGGALGLYTRSALGVRPQAATEVFRHLSWFFGGWPPPRGSLSLLRPLIVAGMLTALATGIISLVALIGLRGSSEVGPSQREQREA
jgi:hypothetical protein